MIYQYLVHSIFSIFLMLSLISCSGFKGFSTYSVQQNTSYSSYAIAPKTTKIGAHRNLNSHSPEAKWPIGVSHAPEQPINGNLWDRLAHGFKLPVPEHSRQIQEQITWFLNHQDYLYRTAKRAAPYMYYIYEQVQQRNLPTELVLLPMLESAYYPAAMSGPGAAGLWQLMPGTANKFGLKQDWWYDGRRDIYASTNAALDYFTYLQNYFNGDCLLAIAAYDSGEGTVQAAIRRNARQGKETDFWALPLPLETRSYVPRLLALAIIIANKDKYSLDLPAINDQPYLEQVDIGAQIDLADAAKLAGISLAELKTLNPGYNRQATDPHGPYKLILPIDKIQGFKESLAKLPISEKTVLTHYKVRRKDTLAKIADRYQVSISELRHVNHLRTFSAPVGKELLIPVVTPAISMHATMENVASNPSAVSTALPQLAAAQTEASNLSTDQDNSEDANAVTSNKSKTVLAANMESEESNQAEETVSIPNQQQRALHTIKKGETLSQIANHYHVDVHQLRKWNNLKSNQKLKPGRTLIVYNEATSAPDQEPANSNVTPHLVRGGDSLAKITHQHHMSVAQLQKLNHLSGNTLTPGQTLQLKPSVVEKASANEEETENKNNNLMTVQTVTASKTAKSAHIIQHIIRSGDTLSSIANRYKVKLSSLKKWNKLNDASPLKPGRKLIIYTTAMD